MYLLMTGQAGLHRRRLLLVAKRRWWIGQRCDATVTAAVIRRLAKPAFGQAAQAAKQLGVTTGHGEVGIMRRRRQGGAQRRGQNDVRVAELLGGPDGHLRQVRQGLVLVQDASGLEPVSVLVSDVREPVQVQQVRPQPIDLVL